MRPSHIAIKPAPKGFDQNALMLMGAVTRSLQIAGALESMFRPALVRLHQALARR